jgi:hypothetical protein
VRIVAVREAVSPGVSRRIGAQRGRCHGDAIAHYAVPLVEWSGPDDARDDEHDPHDDARDRSHGGTRGEAHGEHGWWDDGAFSGGVDDPLIYPTAPIPAHERTWRHPSEIGQAEWTMSEPPVAIGRGLLVTSGAIGSALGVAVLYLMLPAGSSSTASPTATESTAALRSPVVTTAESTTTEFFASDLTDPATSLTWIDRPGLTLPAADTPSTVLVMSVAEPTHQPLSVAVAVEGAPYVITTAKALSDDLEISLLGPGDRDVTPRMEAHVVSISGDLAYLAPSDQMEVVSFARTAAAEPGQIVTVLTDEPSEIEFVAIGTPGGVPDLDAAMIVEGTPVVNADGALVALCTVSIDADRAVVDLVPVEESAVEPSVPATDPDETDASTSTTVPGDGADDSVTTTTEATNDRATTTAPTGAATASSSLPSTDAPTATTSPSGAAVNGSGTSTSAPSATSPATTPASASPTSTSSPAGTGGTSSGAVAWAGLRFDGAPSSAPLTITGVVAGSPAMAAGVMVGERVVAIDGVVVSTLDDVVAAITSRRPGDIAVLTLASRNAGSAVPDAQSSRDISVVLAAFAPTV